MGQMDATPEHGSICPARTNGTRRHTILEAKDYVGPVSILRGKNAKSHVEFASSVTLRYSDAPKNKQSIVSIKNGDLSEEVISECAEEQSYIKFRM